MEPFSIAISQGINIGLWITTQVKVTQAVTYAKLVTGYSSNINLKSNNHKPTNDTTKAKTLKYAVPQTSYSYK